MHLLITVPPSPPPLTDGFHLTRTALDGMPDPATAHARRGSPFTFDPAGLVTVLTAIRSGRGAVAPGFDHAVGGPLPALFFVGLSVLVVLVVLVIVVIIFSYRPLTGLCPVVRFAITLRWPADPSPATIKVPSKAAVVLVEGNYPLLGKLP